MKIASEIDHLVILTKHGDIIKLTQNFFSISKGAKLKSAKSAKLNYIFKRRIIEIS